MPLDHILSFIFTAFILCFAPGPDNIFVLTQSALHGRLSGLFVILGLCSGLVCHTLAVTFGVAVVFEQSAFAFTLLKLVGASYLLYLAVLSFKAGALAVVRAQTFPLSPWQYYRRGLLMNITNPKVSIFFLALLPQFASTGYGPLASQLLLLGGLFIVCAAVVFSAVAFMAGSIGGVIQAKPSVQQWLHRIAGGVFVVLALSLFFATAK